MEETETDNAHLEISKSNEDICKMVGNIMVKTDKNKVEEELKRKQELIKLRLKSIKTQESELTNKAEELKEEVMKKIK